MVGVDDELDYGNDVKIDPNSLEQCLVEQAELYAKWATAWATAVKERRRAKEARAIVHAELEKKARAKWEILGFPKQPTDQMVSNWIPSQDEYKEANFYFIEAEFKANVLEGAKWAFDHRSKALSELVKLFLSGYYADEKMVDKEARTLLEDIRTDNRLRDLNKNDQRKLLKRRKK